MLASLVESGELPQVAERLPEDPLVVQPVDEVGVYGGTWRTATTGLADAPWLERTMGYDRVVQMDLESGMVQPSVLESFDANPDGTEFTLRIRSGVKWSDGTPFTAADIVFWVEDVLGNEELTPLAPIWMLGGGELPDVEAVDELTVRCRFAGPNGQWLQNLSTGSGHAMIGHPRSYLEQFHVAYADADELEALVSEAGVPGWVDLFAQKAGRWENSELPTLQPWRLITPLAENMTRAEGERNPYYWKTDPEGRQLPYIDTIVYEFFSDVETMLTRALNGDFDFHMRHFTTLQNKPLLAESRESGGYRFVDVIPEGTVASVISLNLTSKDNVKREVFQNKDFRIGLSHAIDRQEIIDTVYQQQGEPWQVAPRPESEFFDEEFAKQYTEYDPDLAAEFLDRVLPETNDDGVRLGPDGSPFTFTVLVATGLAPTWPDVLELVRDYWRDVGIDMRIQGQDRSLFVERVTGNDHDAAIWGGDGGNTDILLRPRFYVPTGHNSRCDYAIGWSDWYKSGGEAGVEPPERIRAEFELYDQINQTTDVDEQKDVIRQVIEIAKDEFFAIGINLGVGDYAIVKEHFHNVPDSIVSTVLWVSPGNTEPSQYFLETDS